MQTANAASLTSLTNHAPTSRGLGRASRAMVSPFHAHRGRDVCQGLSRRSVPPVYTSVECTSTGVLPHCPAAPRRSLACAPPWRGHYASPSFAPGAKGQGDGRARALRALGHDRPTVPRDDGPRPGQPQPAVGDPPWPGSGTARAASRSSRRTRRRCPPRRRERLPGQPGRHAPAAARRQRALARDGLRLAAC